MPSRASAEPRRVERAVEDDPAARSEGMARAGEIAIEVDVYRADGPAVGETLDSLTENVSDQLAELDRARAALSDAERGVDTARSAVDETEARIADLVDQTDQAVVEAFVNPPSEQGIEVFGAESTMDATIKRSILDNEATASAAVLEELDTARTEVEVQRATRQDAVAQAESQASDAKARLSDLEAAQSQQALFVAQVQERLDQRLAEADALEALDPAMAASIRERESELASQIEEVRNAEAVRQALEALALAQAQAEAEARAEAERLAAEAAAAAQREIGAPSGSLVSVACPDGGSITVDSAVGPHLEAMVAAASSAGLSLCGGGYRSPDEQVQLRIQNCGSSNYAIYEMPASQCSPPTARPGTSNHEQGLAIDFTCGGSLITSSSDPCFQWLQAHAAEYGFYNLPSERWHWSVDGT